MLLRFVLAGFREKRRCAKVDMIENKIRGSRFSRRRVVLRECEDMTAGHTIFALQRCDLCQQPSLMGGASGEHSPALESMSLLRSDRRKECGRVCQGHVFDKYLTPAALRDCEPPSSFDTGVHDRREARVTYSLW